MVFFRLTRLTVPQRCATVDTDEILEPRIFSLAEASLFVARGKIQEKTVLGLMLVLRTIDGPTEPFRGPACLSVRLRREAAPQAVEAVRDQGPH